MIRQHKRKIIVSTLLIFLPAVFGLLFWNRFPGQMVIHWNIRGDADGTGSRLVAVFAPVLVALAAHISVLVFTSLDTKNRRQTPKALNLLFWIGPAMSFYSSALVYLAAFGRKFELLTVLRVMGGIFFVLIGNYLPKIRQNYTLGIRVPWTLANEENWTRTHRFGGRIWVAVGLFELVAALLPAGAVRTILDTAFFIAIFAPMVYSYVYYRKQRRLGTWEQAEDPGAPGANSSRVMKMSIIFTAVVLLLVVVLLFTGDIRVTCGDTSLAIEATYWPDSDIPYENIDAIEYRDEEMSGTRTNGFGSLRLLMGQFQNSEFGPYTRYTYVGCKACIVLHVKDRVLVLGCKTPEATRAVYEELLTHTDAGKAG